MTFTVYDGGEIIYTGTLEEGAARKDEFFRNEITRSDAITVRDGLYRLPEESKGWYYRIASCNDLDKSKVGELSTYLEQRLETMWDTFIERLESFCNGYKRIMTEHPEALVVCGEGVTYCSSQDVLWEENSELFWKMVRHAMDRYKELGLWGSVIKTCCGPEDPCWNSCKDRLRELNEAFLAD